MGHYDEERSEAQVDTGSKYRKKIKGNLCDVYDVLKAFNVTNPAMQHALKKMLATGNRGVKSFKQDANEAIVSIKRAIELEGEKT